MTTAIPYGLRDIKITPYTDAAGTVLGSPIDLPYARTLSFTDTEDFEELRGDDRVVATHGQTLNSNTVGTGSVADLACGDEQAARATRAVAHRVQLRVQAAFGPSDMPGKSPFLSRLAAVLCAFRWVASIISSSVSPLPFESSTKMRPNTPSSLQRMKRL